MDYTYIKEYQDDIPNDSVDFINKLETTCKAYDISLYSDGKFKSIGELFKDITIANLKLYNGAAYPNN